MVPGLRREGTERGGQLSPGQLRLQSKGRALRLLGEGEAADLTQRAVTRAERPQVRNLKGCPM